MFLYYLPFNKERINLLQNLPFLFYVGHTELLIAWSVNYFLHFLHCSSSLFTGSLLLHHFIIPSPLPPPLLLSKLIRRARMISQWSSPLVMMMIIQLPLHLRGQWTHLHCECEHCTPFIPAVSLLATITESA